jgi:hypothetical protein
VPFSSNAFCYLFSYVQNREERRFFVTTEDSGNWRQTRTNRQRIVYLLCQPHKLLVNIVEKEVCRLRTSHKYVSFCHHSSLNPHYQGLIEFALQNILYHCFYKYVRSAEVKNNGTVPPLPPTSSWRSA